ncbi:hypothetical protein RF11_07560 [Thelohanellus kitauei]|uniref:Serpin domain-containing protein n=1 Tax=Thelohanellus kitauei TaxID=669202 RepID=A0A0C2MIW4_THEKT|nr:hypothetical protein RF11_07560 [Thelohanellus kitauei]
MNNWFYNSEKKRISLYLPILGIVNKISLKSFLSFHHLEGVFNESQADLSKMIKGGGFINEIIHISSIKIDERGSYLPFVPFDAPTILKVYASMSIFVTKPFILYLYKSTNNLTLHISVIVQPFNYL